MDSRDRLPLIHEQPSSQKQSHQEREKNQQNHTKKDFESTELYQPDAPRPLTVSYLPKILIRIIHSYPQRYL